MRNGTMTGHNYYCAGDHCRRTTERVRVHMKGKTYFYCVDCGKRLEERNGYEHTRTSRNQAR
ncbi:MAG: hypothetical protein ACYTGV_07345 [Planctomycetota bacterium]